MTFLSGFELVNKQLRQEAEERARRPVTPQHAACEAAVAGDDDELARERARRVQHEADPVGDVATPDMDKVFRDALPGPGAYPDPSALTPGRGADHHVPRHAFVPPGIQAAPSQGYQLPAAFVVPTATLNAVNFTRGPLGDGHAAPSPSHLEGV